MTVHHDNPNGSERGDAMVVFCVAMILLILPLGGISIDLWHAISAERALQAAADAAATAGADAINTTAYRNQQQLVLDPAQATQTAAANLNAQTALPALSSPPEIDVAPQQITVRLHANIHLTLLRIIAGDHPINITATAISAPRPSGHP